MPQSLSQIYVHLVFSTKHRSPWLSDNEVRDRLYAYMAKVLREGVDSPALIINGVEDHIHALLRLSRRFAMMKVVQACKVQTSKWLKRQPSISTQFAWQSGYGAFSVSASITEQVRLYIQNQREHHQGVSFKDEYRALCRRHGLTLDERYAWD